MTRSRGPGQSITAADQPAGITEQLTGLIRTNVPLQPGDSGGPLVSPAGQVIAMNTAASSQFQITSGTTQAFAIPASQAVSIAARIVACEASVTVHIGATAAAFGGRRRFAADDRQARHRLLLSTAIRQMP